MIEKTIDVIKNGSIVIPKVLFNNYKNLKLTEKEFLVLIFLINNDNLFDPSKISKSVDMELIEVLEIIESLNTKDLVKIDICNENGIRMEKVNLDNLYNKLAYLVVNEKEEKDETKKTNIYDIFEKEFGRTLSPIEYELINGWIEEKFTEELIVCALKEAVFNGVNNLRYIDKILYEWKKKGIKNKEDILKDKKNFSNKKEEKKELFDYDWLNENE